MEEKTKDDEIISKDIELEGLGLGESDDISDTYNIVPSVSNKNLPVNQEAIKYTDKDITLELYSSVLSINCLAELLIGVKNELDAQLKSKKQENNEGGYVG